MYLGSKARYNRLEQAYALSKNIEFHVEYSDMTDPICRSTISSFFSKNKPKELSAHIPLDTPLAEKCFELSAEEYAKFLKSFNEFQDFLNQFTDKPIVQVIHCLDNGSMSLQEIFNFIINNFEEKRVYGLENYPEREKSIFSDLKSFNFMLDNAPKNIGMTLDVSHYFLNSKPREELKKSLTDFVNSYADRIYHLHLSDVIDSDIENSEGTQIGKGNNDWNYLLDLLSQVDCMAIPEIKEGHLNNNAGFIEASKILKENYSKYFEDK